MIIEGKSSYQLPEPGTVQGVLAEIVDLGLKEVEWKGDIKLQQKCLFTFEIDQENDRGERLIVSRQFTASFAENANLRKFLESWRGQKFTPEEIKRFDTDKLLGMNAILTLSHSTSGDRTYCNIENASKTLKTMPKMSVSENYVPYEERMARRKERERQNAVSPSSDPYGETLHNEHETVPEDDSSEIPF